MSPLLLVAVGFGGALGALCRSKATGFLKARTHGDFPVATLIINICSCTLAGIALAGIALAVQADLNEVLYLAATMGFLGGFSTLSTMNYEAVELVLGGKRALGAGYLAATYASTLGAAALGFAIASAVM